MHSRKRKNAVVIRTHVHTAKVDDLIRQLSGFGESDVYVLKDVTAGSYDFDNVNQLSISNSVFDQMGVKETKYKSFWHFGDMPLYFIAKELADYASFTMIDYDVCFVHDNISSLMEISHSLSSGKVDLAGMFLGRRDASWMWYADARQRYTNVFGLLGPIIGISAAAIDYLEPLRVREFGDLRSGITPTYFEAFIPSALTEGGFNCLDINDISPSSYRWESCHCHYPFLLGDLEFHDGNSSIIHPVFDAEPLLEKYFNQFKFYNCVQDFRAALESATRHRHVSIGPHAASSLNVRDARETFKAVDLTRIPSDLLLRYIHMSDQWMISLPQA